MISREEMNKNLMKELMEEINKIPPELKESVQFKQFKTMMDNLNLQENMEVPAIFRGRVKKMIKTLRKLNGGKIQFLGGTNGKVQMSEMSENA